eukprot:377387-Karenia_brevis.AAC.1
MSAGFARIPRQKKTLSGLAWASAMSSRDAKLLRISTAAGHVQTQALWCTVSATPSPHIWQ